MKRKLISLMLIAVMMFSLFAMSACGSDDTPADDTGDTVAANEGGDDAAADEGGDDAVVETPAETDPPEPEIYQPDDANEYTGGVGFGAWETSMQYDDLKVTDNKNRKVLYENKFDDAATFEDFTFHSRGSWDAANAAADWKIADGVMEFTNADANGVLAWTGNPDWGNYTISLKGKITGGKEGMTVMFGVKDENNYYLMTVGGWGNTLICVEQAVDGVVSVITDQIPLTLAYGTSYTFSVNVGASVIRGYVDGEQFFQIGGTLPGEADGFKGMVGMSGWSTEVAFDNVKVTSIATGEVMYENSFDNVADLDTFKYDFTYSGGSHTLTSEPWEIVDGTLKIVDASRTGVCVGMGDATWRNYIYEMEAMPISGAEGFTIIGGIAASDTFNVYNTGGWSNTKACYQILDEGVATDLDQIDLSVPYEEWTKMKMVVMDYAIFTYKDGEFCQAYWK